MASYIERARFPAGVHLDENGLVDAVLRQSYPLSPSARMYLGLIARGMTFAEIERRVSSAAGVSTAVVGRDVRGLACQLNRALLLNLELGGLAGQLRWAWWMVWSAAFARSRPILRRQRFPVRTSLLHAHADVACGVFRGMAPAWLVLGALTTAAWIVAPGHAVVCAVGPAFPAAIVVHEAAHAIAVGRRGERLFLRVSGVSVGVVHRRLPSAPVAHASGPLVTAACGALLLGVAYASSSAPLALASTPFLAQGLALTVLAADGRLLFGNPQGPVDTR